MADRSSSVPALVAAAVLLLALALRLATWDVHSDIDREYAGQGHPEPGGSFCGSAYDVALLEGDGFMGGEVPVNQRAIDRDCVPRAGRLVVAATAAGTLGLGVAVAGVVVLVRRRQRETGADAVSPARPSRP